MAIKQSELSELITERKTIHRERDQVGQRVRDAQVNEFNIAWKDILDPGEEPIVANLVATGAWQYAQRVGKMPRLVCQPITRQPQPASRDAKARAERHEKRLTEYVGLMGLPTTLAQAAYWLVSHGLVAFVVRPSAELGIPVIELRDPLGTYPSQVWPWRPGVTDCLFLSRMQVRQARALWPDASLPNRSGQVEVAEFWEPEGVTFALSEAIAEDTSRRIPGLNQAAGHRIVERVENPMGESAVFIGRGLSADGDFHGQFDNAIPALLMQARLRALQMKAAHRLAIPHVDIVGNEEVEIKSNGGKYLEGPGALNIIQGGESRNVSAQMSNQVFAMDANLADAVRQSSIFPPLLSGLPTSAITTGKGTEALAVPVDDNTAYWQSVLARPLEAALTFVARMARQIDATGAEDFSELVTTNTRFLAGVDPGQTIRQMQLHDVEWLSSQTAIDSLPEVSNPLEEMALIKAEKGEEVLFQSILARFTAPDPLTGAPPDPAPLADFIRLVRSGVSPEDAYSATQATQAPPAPSEPLSLDSLFGGSTQTIAQSQAGGPGGFIGARTTGGA